MKEINKQQIKQIQTMISTLGLREQKEELLLSVSLQRTSSVGQLSYDEANILIKKLYQLDPRQKMFQKLYKIALSLGWAINAEGRRDEVERRLNDWSIKYGKFHKPLRNHTYQELQLLVSQLEKLKK